jgi:uncharacterized membrane protein YraQ (UPF0718 family)/YHS domain-containing protein
VIAFISLADVGDSLREAFFMFWETLWALVLGFTLSGAVQAFVSRERMQRVMGDHRIASVARASGFGMVSSSCSYAATAMARSLFRKGADFTTSMIFMFASTNLVIELGIVLVVLLGWQFALAEFVGGPIMIALLALIGGWVFGPRLVQAARSHAGADTEREHEQGAGITTQAGWSDAAKYTISDLNMIRRDLVIGYLVAGFLAVLVPLEWWNGLFLHGHGFWTSLENAIVGPLIACVSFVCSIGNVPLAAALWNGGIAFGGVIAFIFADLIALPLLFIYRKFYGTRMMLRIFFTFWGVMAAAGLIVEGIFAAFGAIPTERSATIVDEHFAWNYTTFLNIIFLLVFALVFWLSRRPGSEDRFATDPTCGMQVEKAIAPAHCVDADGEHWFCSDHCHEKYLAASPEHA